MTTQALQLPAKRKWGDTPVVTLIVGESKTVFILHEAELFEASPFFKAGFTSNFKEGSERTMNLLEDDVETFEGFVDWLYRRTFEMPTSPPDARFMAPLKLFVLADKYQAAELKNIIIEKMWALGKGGDKPPAMKEVAYAYANTTQGSGMRRLLADWYSWRIDLNFYENTYFQAFMRRHRDCAADFSVSLAKRLRNPPPKFGASIKDPFAGDMPEEFRDKDSRQAA